MTASVTPESTSNTAYYVYGIVPADAPVEMVAEAGLGGQVELHTDGSVGALVEAVEIDRPLGRRRDLVAHSTVLNTMAAHGPVLPMRFGSVVDGERAVVRGAFNCINTAQEVHLRAPGRNRANCPMASRWRLDWGDSLPRHPTHASAGMNVDASVGWGRHGEHKRQS